MKKASDGSGRLFAGDVIIRAQGVPVTCTDDLLRIKDWLIVGEELHLQVWTGEKTLEISIKLQRSGELSDSPVLQTRREDP